MTLKASGISADSYTAFGNIATGHFTGDGSGSVEVKLGFTPVYVKLIDMAASTGSSEYEWILGMAATDSLLTTGLVDPAIDANSAIVSNGKISSRTEVAFPAPGAQTPDDGTNGTISVSVYSPDPTVARLTFGINVTSHVYVWVAIG